MNKTPIQEIYIPYFFQTFFKLGKIVETVSSQIKLSDYEKENKFHYIKAETEIFVEIKKLLENNLNYPIMSKQTLPSFDKSSSKFWLINILNDYDSFMKKERELSIEISLIEDKKSVVGFIYFPFADELYFGMKNYGVYKLENLKENLKTSVEANIKNILIKLPFYANNDFLVIDDKKLESLHFIKSLTRECSFSGEIHLKGARKFTEIIEGNAGVYLNIEPSLEWDTAAAHAMLMEIGKNIFVEETKTELLYSKNPYLNPPILIM